jgi:hypothetical protein
MKRRAVCTTAIALLVALTAVPSRAADDDGSSKPADNATTQPATRKAKRKGATQAGDATSTTTRATSGPVAATLPAEFAIFEKRNGFARGHGKAGGAGGPEAMFALKGIADVGSHLTAFFEDTRSKNVTQAAVGDPIARGRVKKLDLDSIEYEANGETKRIEVGQNLNGEVVPPTPPASKPAENKNNPGGPGGPPGPDGAPPGAPGEGQPSPPKRPPRGGNGG